MKSNIVANGKMKDWRSRKCMTAEQNRANFVCGVRLTLSCPRSFWAHLVDFFPERRFSKRYSYSFDSFSTKHFFKFLMTVLKCYLQKFWNFKFWEKKTLKFPLIQDPMGLKISKHLLHFWFLFNQNFSTCSLTALTEATYVNFEI